MPLQSSTKRIATHPDGIFITVLSDAEAVANEIADQIAAAVERKPDLVLSLPTGGTPIPLYAELVRRSEAGTLDLSRARVFALDEYLGVGPDQPGGLIAWLKRTLLLPIGFPEDRFHPIPATAVNPTDAANEFEHEIKTAGGLDLCVLGLGANGHVAFNEPGSPADSRTRVLDLTDESVAQAAGDWPTGERPPRQAMTMGIATILDARGLILMVTGASKAAILRQSLENAPTADIPATLIRVAGDRLSVICDEPAAATLNLG